ncbi:hypothetical protein [Kitasatospora sp. NPDC050543]|uniref:hypothetical protein n=1 Tax=Kitasatospora sp. NPDC050543 TaxID=3364054 RepID=UPI0037B3012B
MTEVTQPAVLCHLCPRSGAERLYDRTYYEAFTAVEKQVRQDLAAGRQHLAEAEMQRAARSRRRGHTTP